MSISTGSYLGDAEGAAPPDVVPAEVELLQGRVLGERGAQQFARVLAEVVVRQVQVLDAQVVGDDVGPDGGRRVLEFVALQVTRGIGQLFRNE